MTQIPDTKLAHEVIDKLETLVREQQRKIDILEKAARQALKSAKTTYERKCFLYYAADALAEIHPGFENMSYTEQVELRWRYTFEPGFYG